MTHGVICPQVGDTLGVLVALQLVHKDLVAQLLLRQDARDELPPHVLQEGVSIIVHGGGTASKRRVQAQERIAHSEHGFAQGRTW